MNTYSVRTKYHYYGGALNARKDHTQKVVAENPLKAVYAAQGNDVDGPECIRKTRKSGEYIRTASNYTLGHGEYAPPLFYVRRVS